MVKLMKIVFLLLFCLPLLSGCKGAAQAFATGAMEAMGGSTPSVERRVYEPTTHSSPYPSRVQQLEDRVRQLEGPQFCTGGGSVHTRCR